MQCHDGGGSSVQTSERTAVLGAGLMQTQLVGDTKANNMSGVLPRNSFRRVHNEIHSIQKPCEASPAKYFKWLLKVI